MPQIGDIRKNQNYIKFVWAACEGCGRERWVRIAHGYPAHNKCRSCVRLSVNNSNWKGGQFYHDGYVLVRKPDHPDAGHDGYIKRARLVLEEKLGRYLLPGMDAHHKNGIKDDDKPENLEELFHGKHTSKHRMDSTFITLCSGCGVPLLRYIDRRNRLNYCPECRAKRWSIWYKRERAKYPQNRVNQYV